MKLKSHSDYRTAKFIAELMTVHQCMNPFMPKTIRATRGEVEILTTISPQLEEYIKSEYISHLPGARGKDILSGILGQIRGVARHRTFGLIDRIALPTGVTQSTVLFNAALEEDYILETVMKTIAYDVDGVTHTREVLILTLAGYNSGVFLQLRDIGFCFSKALNLTWGHVHQARWAQDVIRSFRVPMAEKLVSASQSHAPWQRQVMRYQTSDPILSIGTVILVGESQDGGEAVKAMTSVVVDDISTLPLGKLLRCRVDKLRLSTRPARCLEAADVRYIGDLVHMTEDELLRLSSFGRRSLREVQETLKRLNLGLGMDIPTWRLLDL